MKKYAITLCLLLAALTVQAGAIRDEANFSGDDAQTSYAFGMTVGIDLEQTGMEIDYDAFMEGLKAAMERKPTIMDRDKALELVQDAFENAMKKQSAGLAAQEEAFLAENASQAGIMTTESGLQYMVLEEGTGPRPIESDIVRVHYEGALTNGTVFDSSYEREEPEEIPLDMVISGWAEGLLLMNVGSKYRIYIPSRMAYGERGAGQVIPPFSTLVFTVELLDIIKLEDKISELNAEDEDSSGELNSEDEDSSGKPNSEK